MGAPLTEEATGALTSATAKSVAKAAVSASLRIGTKTAGFPALVRSLNGFQASSLSARRRAKVHSRPLGDHRKLDTWRYRGATDFYSQLK